MDIQIFEYNGNGISFGKEGNVMVNATEMAKAFGKLVGDWLRLKTTNEFTEALSTDMQIPISALIQVVKGGNNEQGTWLHEDIALEFARWLSPAFAIWCNKRIKELLQYGMTATQPTLEQMINNPDLVISLATQLKNERDEKQRLQAQAEQQQVTIELQENEIKKSAPKVSYYDSHLQFQKFAQKNTEEIFSVLKNIPTFVAVTDGNCIYLAGQAVKLLILYMGIFYTYTLRYWRLPIRRYWCALRGMLPSVTSVYGSRFLFTMKFAYNISLNGYRYE